MASLRYPAGLVVALMVHLLGAQLSPLWLRLVDPFVVLVVLWAVGRSSLAGTLGGLGAGLVQDALTGGIYGLYGFADTIIGYAAARAGQRVVIRGKAGVLLVVATGSLLQQGIAVLLVLVFLPGAELPEPLWVVPRAALSGVAALVAVVLGQAVARRRERRRRRSRSRLRLDR